MPTYEYECKACGHTFEEFQSMTAKRLKKCPACGKLKLERLIGIGAGVIFKGSGFYETDYRSDKYQKDAKADTDRKTDTGDNTNKDASKSSDTQSGSKTGDKPEKSVTPSAESKPTQKSDSPKKSDTPSKKKSD